MLFEIDADVMSIEKTVDYILSTHCSISRFGDGEIGMMHGFSLGFQRKDRRLAKELRKVYLTRKKELLICIPEPLMTMDALKKDSQVWWRDYFSSLVHRWFWIHGVKDMRGYHFGNAFLSRPYMSYEDKENARKRFDKIKMLWNSRDVVLIEGKKSRIGIGNDLLDNVKSLKRVIAPVENAYEKIDELESFIVSGVSRKTLLILALGPTATVLAARLCNAGYQALDLGHVDIEYEWALMGVNSKVPIKDKYTNEAKAGKDVTEQIADEQYCSEIVADFS